MKQQQPKRLYRSPKGVVTNKPIYVRLMPDELEKMQNISSQEVRSISAQARLFIVEGMNNYLDEAEHQ
ncbi:MAG: hypothetical protein U9Q87_02855 [Pseudomonadota bacterium]|nr:hypothetical protein [Pseudomonadota bacterium]|tara:strand:- start:29520 stop:29723 length:204 start_codon:yes stop_codon:yes gene_type:complete